MAETSSGENHIGSSNPRITKYNCETCSKTHNYVIDEIEHLHNIQQTANGLMKYPSFHRCSNGILQLINLDVDREYNTRSYQMINLPNTGIRQIIKTTGLPSPKSSDEDTVVVNIPTLPIKKQFRLILMDHGFNTSLKLGKIDVDHEDKLSLITSDQGTINLFYYPSEVVFSAAIERWLTFLVNSMEGFLPSKLGLIIEVLTYISDQHDTYPTDFERKIVSTIFSSHEVFFEIQNELDESHQDYLTSKYGESKIQVFLGLTKHISNNPGIPLIEYMKWYDGSFHDLISVFFFMELESMVKIHRPGIIDFF